MMQLEKQTGQQERRGLRPGPRIRAALLAGAAGMVLAAATAYVVAPGPAPGKNVALAGAGQAAQAASHHRAGARPPLRVLSVSPANSAVALAGAHPVRVVFSAPLAAGSPLPGFSPAVRGRWHAGPGDSLVFTPARPFGPATQVTLRIPAGRSGVRSATGARLATPATAVFQAGGWSALRTEQLLAQLGYLPLTWTPDSSSGVAPPATGPVTASYRQPVPAAAPRGTGPQETGPGAGVFTWLGSYPAALTSLWQPGQPSAILTGALMAFQADQGLAMTGTGSRTVIRALLRAAALGQRDPHGYTFAVASKTLPETLTVWHNGRIVSRGLANTGAAGTPTPDGTFPVYLRRKFQIMRGTAPDGAAYADPVHYVSFFHGDYAVHSMVRPSYGHPQSLGCVELPLSEARRVWPYLTYGSLVTVVG